MVILMYTKQEAIEYVSTLKVNIVCIEDLIGKFYADDVNLKSHPALRQLNVDLKEINASMINAQALIGVVVSKIADEAGDFVGNIKEEMEMLEGFSASLVKVKNPLQSLSIVIDEARAQQQ